MTAIDTRSLKRDSLFLSADLTLGEGGEPVRVKVRNLSDGGMMAEADLEVERGMRLGIELRNIGRIKGSVAWTQDNRFGIVFDNEIDSKRVREPAATRRRVMSAPRRSRRKAPSSTSRARSARFDDYGADQRARSC